jgi:hypothetical protein
MAAVVALFILNYVDELFNNVPLIKPQRPCFQVVRLGRYPEPPDIYDCDPAKAWTASYASLAAWVLRANRPHEPARFPAPRGSLPCPE